MKPTELRWPTAPEDMPAYAATRYGRHIGIIYGYYVPDEVGRPPYCTGNSPWCLCRLAEDGTPVSVIGYDGGEPEDQILVRDWEWVAHYADVMETERSNLTAEVNRLQDELRKVTAQALDYGEDLLSIVKAAEKLKTTLSHIGYTLNLTNAVERLKNGG